MSPLDQDLWTDAFFLASPAAAKDQFRGLIHGCLAIVAAITTFGGVATFL
jgi:hypothetical protein